MVAGPPPLRVGSFSTQSPSRDLPKDWEQIRFGENASSTTYELVRIDSTVVVHAQSENGASGLITRRRIRLSEYPVLEWRWKVEGVPAGANVATDTTDDAAARLYVTFDYDDLGFFDRIKLMLLRQVGYPEAPSRALNYVWATRQERGTSVTSPYTDQIMMIPLRRGTAQGGEWVHERRNVLADYRRVFGEDPPAVNGVALMTDTDNTGGTAEAYYGDIVFRPPAEGDTANAASSGAE
jgi:hypothetical protein